MAKFHKKCAVFYYVFTANNIYSNPCNFNLQENYTHWIWGLLTRSVLKTAVTLATENISSPPNVSYHVANRSGANGFVGN